jgi:lipopolysaccharide heptosyltransferase II
MGYAWYTVSALGTALHTREWARGSLRRILFVKTDHLGDVLLALPAVRDFLATEPNATAGFLGGSWNRAILERVPWISEVHAFDSRRFTRRGRPSPDSALDDILARDWDLIVDLTNDPAIAATAFSRRSRFRRDVGGFRLDAKLRRTAGQSEVRAERHVSRIAYRALGLPVPDPIVPVALRLREEDVGGAAGALARAWPGDRPIAALHAGATWEFRRWPAGRFAELAKRLEAEGFAAILVGGTDDRAVSLEVAHAAGLRESRVLAGELSLAESAAALQRAAIVIANDGGLMHLAATMGAPVVGIYGPTDPDLFGPIGATSTAIIHRRDCSPCSQRHCIWGRARCLEPIEIQEVFAAALRLARRTAA